MQVWREIVARFAQSGLSEAAFCEGEGISGKSFHLWRTKRVKVMPRAPVDKPTRVAPSSASSAGFVDLGSLKDSGSKLEMRLDLGGEVILHVVRG